jgi:glycerol-3-phosphate dehydrogenase
MRVRSDVEPLSDRLWRRYGRRAFAMLEAIRSDPSMAEEVMAPSDYLRVELHLAASTEMVTRLEDFMRRRTKIDQVVPAEAIRSSEGLADVARILFGDAAEAKLAEYLESPPAATVG